jgi:hypothetical protein
MHNVLLDFHSILNVFLMDSLNDGLKDFMIIEIVILMVIQMLKVYVLDMVGKFYEHIYFRYFLFLIFDSLYNICFPFNFLNFEILN